ncbi:nucleoside triphosphate pyrophosphohydrolase [Acetobacter musti]|uniref:Nucleoside triphosphate pyrophosphohydrolase n=2 Tax=Acetobacter musti TaxID=864732 RepID=A0ABX0JLQ6_9PROT|nr:nucleoside triphosphate pyrophosphohydrolase [Acetobacter musti]NHN83590.1 nucleoside triphosphate pyrophosphohydrolase [Acetobacter musti]
MTRETPFPATKNDRSRPDAITAAIPDTATDTAADAARELERLIGVMARLRDPATGYPWDIDQTPQTIAPYAIEEAYEVADAIDRGAWDDVADELGDLLLQVVYQARMAEEEGRFAFATVARLITDKMIRRHPHVFGSHTSGETTPATTGDSSAVFAQWEAGKEQERIARAEHGTLAGIPRALPALLRARKIAARAARVGFDWPDVSGVVAKVHEELAEVEAEIESGDRTALQDEMGDLLFSVATLARRLDLDPEACLRQASDKFTRRFQALEAILASRGLTPAGQSVDDLDAVWREVKQRETEAKTKIL